MLWFGRIKRRFPVSELAGVAPKAQNTSCRECFELANQAAVLRRKETRVRELLHLIRQADKVNGHMRAIAVRLEWREQPGPGFDPAREEALQSRCRRWWQEIFVV